jgi:hypothetical protein
MQLEEIEELACLMLGKDYDSIIDNYEESVIENMFYEEYNITLEDFEHILDDLIKFTNFWESPLTGKLYQGFIIQENDKSLSRAIIKKEYDKR